MPENWKTYKLGDLGTIARGKSKHRPRDASHLYGGEYPFIQTGDVKASNHRLNNHTQTYSEDGLLQSKLWPKNTMCITIAANIAETAILNYPACFPDSIIGFIANEEVSDIDFVEYLMQYFKRQIQSHSIGSVQDNINLATFQRVEFKIPPLPEQQAIASILSSLDDKIELNLQMNKTLEEMAMALYKHWFVDFGPFKEGKFIDSELGLIPEGWEVTSIGEYVDILNSKRVPLSTKQRSSKKGKYPYYGASGIIDNINDYIFDGEHVIISEDGENLRSRKTPIAFTAYGQFWVNNHAHVLKGKTNGLNELLIHHFSQLDLNPYLTGAVQPKLNKQNLLLISIPFPGSLNILKPVLDEFYSLSRLTLSNILENQTLTSLRDTLLPKLISGAIRVKEAEQTLAEVL